MEKYILHDITHFSSSTSVTLLVLYP